MAEGLSLGAASGELALHLAACATCAARVERASLRSRLLAGLPARRAPAALDALVATELGRRPIERALHALDRRPAPAVLERLVAEEIARPAAAVARRALHGLPRHPAPADAEPSLAPIGRRSRLRRLVGGLGLAAAATVVAWFGGPALGPRPDGSDATRTQRVSGERSAPKFRLVVVNSVDELDPLARGFAEGLAGRPLGR